MHIAKLSLTEDLEEASRFCLSPLAHHGPPPTQFPLLCCQQQVYLSSSSWEWHMRLAEDIPQSNVSKSSVTIFQMFLQVQGNIPLSHSDMLVISCI